MECALGVVDEDVVEGIHGRSKGLHIRCAGRLPQCIPRMLHKPQLRVQSLAQPDRLGDEDATVLVLQQRLLQQLDDARLSCARWCGDQGAAVVPQELQDVSTQLLPQ